MQLVTKVAYNAVAQVVGKGVSTFLGLLAVAMMTRYLGSAGFGQYTTIITFASIFAIVADLGLTLVASQLINRPQADSKYLLDNLFGFRLVSALVIIGLAPLAVWLFPYGREIKIGVGIISFSYLFFSFNQVFVALFQRELTTHLIAVAEAVSRLILVAAVWAVVVLNGGLLGMLLAMVAANFVSFALHYGFAQKITPVRFKFTWPVWREIIGRSWPLLATIVLNLIYLKADIIFLSLMKSESDVGLYGAAYKVVDVLVAVPFLLAGLVLPILVKEWTGERRLSWQAVGQKFFDVLAIGVLPLAVGGWLLARPLMTLVAGGEFVVSGDILKILLLAVVAVFGSCFFTHLVISFDGQKRMIKYFFLTALTAVPVYFYLITRYSYFGAAWGTVYSEVLILFFSIAAVWRASRWRPRLTTLLKALAAALVMGAGIWWLRGWAEGSTVGLVTLLILAAAFYLGLILLFGAFRKEEFTSLIKGK